MTDTYFDIFGQKSNAIFQQNNYSANTFDFLIPTCHTQSVKNPSIMKTSQPRQQGRRVLFIYQDWCSVLYMWLLLNGMMEAARRFCL